MITYPPTITISRSIFDDINTWLDEHNKKDVIIVSIIISSRWYIINYNTTNEFEEINIPVEDIIKISHNKNKEFQQDMINKYIKHRKKRYL